MKVAIDPNPTYPNGDEIATGNGQNRRRRGLQSSLCDANEDKIHCYETYERNQTFFDSTRSHQIHHEAITTNGPSPNKQAS